MEFLMNFRKKVCEITFLLYRKLIVIYVKLSVFLALQEYVYKTVGFNGTKLKICRHII